MVDVVSAVGSVCGRSGNASASISQNEEASARNECNQEVELNECSQESPKIK